MLSIDHLKTVSEKASKRLFTDRGADIGLYWDSMGFVHGPGFRAFAKDFPEGTVIRVTAEIILPTH